jgi:hypothetical protein
VFVRTYSSFLSEIDPVRKLTFQFFTFLAILATSACSSSSTPLYPVEGKVLYKGKEISNVLVTFHPIGGDPIKALRPTGLSGENGAFTVSTGKDAGAPPGEYSVTFNWRKEIPIKEKKGMSMGPATDIVDGFNGTFSDPSKSNHKVTIKSAQTKLEPFQL